MSRTTISLATILLCASCAAAEDNGIHGDAGTDSVQDGHEVPGDTAVDTGWDTDAVADTVPDTEVPPDTSTDPDATDTSVDPDATDTYTDPDVDPDTSVDIPTDGWVPCPICLRSMAPACTSNVAVVGHYVGGTKTICIMDGDGSAIRLALMSYDVTNWELAGALYRLPEVHVYGHDGIGTITAPGVTVHTYGPGGTCDPYTYASSMGDCDAHTGWTSCIFGGIPPSDVCHMESGIASECNYPTYTCLAIDP